MNLPCTLAAGFALALYALPGAAQQQAVYRCGADGRVYQSTPCPQGRPLAVDDARSSADRSSAAAVAQKDAELAARLERERLEREQPPAGGGVTGIDGRLSPGRQGSAERPRPRLGKSGASAAKPFVAVDPASHKKKKQQAD